MHEEPNKDRINLTIRRSHVVNIILILELVLLGIFGFQLQNLKKNLAAAEDQASPKKTAVNIPSRPTAPPSGDVPPPDQEDHYKGNPDAAVTLIEYSDFECPFCKRFHPTAKHALNEYEGQVNWVYRHFPLSFHVNAQKEGEAAECAGEIGGDEVFWGYTDAIFKRTSSNGTGFALNELVPLAVELGLDRAAFQECLDSGKYAEHVKQDMAKGAAAGVTGTPGTFVYNNETGESELVPGAVPFAQLQAAIEKVRNR